MSWKEQVDALKAKFKGKIKDDSSQEEIEEINGLIAEIDALDSAHTALEEEHAKTKESLVRLVINQGSSDKPKDESGGSKPKTIEECVAEVQKEGK